MIESSIFLKDRRDSSFFLLLIKSYIFNRLLIDFFIFLRSSDRYFYIDRAFNFIAASYAFVRIAKKDHEVRRRPTCVNSG